jgi:hypothetical protein
MLRASKIKIVLASVACLCAVLLLFGWMFQGPDVRSYAIMTNCNARMRIAARALYAFANAHRDIPRNESGEFLPDLLICQSDVPDENCVPKTAARCTLRRADGTSWDGLVWCEISDFRAKAFIPGHPESSLKIFVLMCHGPDSLHRIDNKWYAPVLLSNGVGLLPVVDPTEYRRWFDTEFRRGNLAIPPFVSEFVKDFP